MKPELGKEYPAQDEQQDIQDIIDAIKANLGRVYKRGYQNRQFHAKMHACIKGEFVVDPALPAGMQAGTFIAGKRYDCWVRLSNGNTKIVDDRKADLRGFAIKLIDVPGEQLVPDISMSSSHDFLLVSYPTLFASGIKDMKKSIKALCDGMLGMITFAVNPFNWGILIRTLASMKKTDNLLAIPYWSVSPYRYGEGDKAVKYKLVPATSNLAEPVSKDAGFLQETIIADLARQDISFDFMIQFQEDAIRDPIENPTREWQSPFHKIGTLTLPRQQFIPQDTMAFGDNLTYSPWHCTAAHQPLGGINRARRAAYDAIAKCRIEHNDHLMGIPLVEVPLDEKTIMNLQEK